MSDSQKGSGKTGASAELDVDAELMAYTQETKPFPPKRNLDDMKIEQLYMLEVLVKSVEIQSELSPFKDQEVPPLCVRIKFIDFPCIEIGQEDFLGSDDESKHEGQIPGASVPPLPLNVPTDKTSSIQQSTKTPPKPAEKPSKTATDSADKNLKQSKSDKSVKSERSSKLDNSKTGKKGITKTPTKDSKSKRSATKLNSIDFSSGKSCLFPMLPLELIRQLQRYPVSIHVFYKTTDEIIQIGQCKVRLGTQFEDAIIKTVYDNDPLPVTTALECESKLNSVFGDHTGRISTFIRLSCFGATIITQFQLRGQEHQEHIFKTSKKDNTIEAQKKKGFLYGKGPIKTDLVKPLVDRHDISPLKPIITDESILPMIKETKESIPTKIVPWKKYVEECGCENPNKEYLTDYTQEFQNMDQPFAQNNTPLSTNPPCPVSECGCFGTSTKNQMPPKCPLLDCDCYNSSRSDKQNSVTYPQYKPNRGRINDCCKVSNNVSESYTKTRRNTDTSGKYLFIADQFQSIPENQFSIDKARCYIDAISSRGRNQTEAPGTFNHKILNHSPNSSLDQKNISMINKYTSKLQNGKQTQNSINDQSKNLQQDIDNCFFANFHVSQQTQFQDNAGNCSKNVPQRQANSCCCKMGTNNRGEYFCYRSDDDGGNISTQSGIPKIPGSQQIKHSGIGDQPGALNPCNQDKLSEHVVDNTSQIISINEFQDYNSQQDEPLFTESKRLSEKQTAKYDSTGGGGDTNKSSVSEPSKDFDPKPSRKSGNESTKKITDGRSEESKKLHKEKDKEKSISDKSNGDSYTDREAKRRRKRYFESIYHYTAGMYPGINIGHRYCTRDFRLVPKTMGWLWNVEDSGDGLPMRRGWIPGAINRKIATMMKKGKKAGMNIEKEEVAPPKSTKGGKRKRPNQIRNGNTASGQNIGDYITGPQSPTLHIHKKDGAYFIAMNPIKTDSEEEDEERSPLLFKILPHDDEVSTSSESSLEIEFTAPGAFRKKTIKPVMMEIDTQYSDPDSIVEILQPPTGKGKKGDKGEKSKKVETPSSKGSEPKENKWDVDQPTQIAKTKK